MAYFDHAATTPTDHRVADVIAKYLAEGPLNPSSIHRSGQDARRLLERCREDAAELLGLGAPETLVFLSGATEGANLLLRTMVERADRPLRVLSSEIEHACVRDTLEALAEPELIELTLLPVGEDGRVELESAGEADLLCLMAANNETGVIQDLEAAKSWRDRFEGRWLCDATQAIGKVLFAADALGADVYLMSGHKLYAPAGVGAVFGPAITKLGILSTGGPQEDEHRAGTQAVPLIAGMVEALGLALAEREERAVHTDHLSARFVQALDSDSAGHRLNGTADRLPGFLNISFPGFEATDLAIALDARGYCVSPGSACSTGVTAISPTLAAMVSFLKRQ